MNNKLFLIIKTNLHTGDFDRELMAYVFGFDKDGDGSNELNFFEKEMGTDCRDEFGEYLDLFAFGDGYAEYSCYKIGSHPTNKQYKCDSIYICLQKTLSKNLTKIVVNRLKSFSDYYNKKYERNLNILDIDYYKNNFTKVDEKDLVLGK